MASALSRDPNDYRPDPNGHFRRRKSERDVPGEAIRACIEDGDIVERRNGGQRIKLRSEWCNGSYYVVVDTSEKLAITCGVSG
jgi:hypothetical protein